jgi:cytochrome c biogenesis protein CcmG/thiol:disulfide interchange protein DsbE
VNRKVLVAGLVVSAPLIVLLVMSLGRDPQKFDSPLVGRQAPRFALAPVGGGEAVSLDALRGKAVVVNFWATWCTPCFQEHPVLVAGAQRFADVVFLGVIYQDEENKVERFVRERGESYPSLMDADGKTAIAYGVYGVPETFFISPDGTIASKYVGPLTAGLLETFVQEARAGNVRQSAR